MVALFARVKHLKMIAHMHTLSGSSTASTKNDVLPLVRAALLTAHTAVVHEHFTDLVCCIMSR